MQFEEETSEVCYTMKLPNFSTYTDIRETFTEEFPLKINNFSSLWRLTLAPFVKENGCNGEDLVNRNIGIVLKCLSCNVNHPEIEIYSKVQGRDQHEKQLGKRSGTDLTWQGIIISRLSLKVFRLISDDQFKANLKFIVKQSDLSRAVGGVDFLSKDMKVLLENGSYSDVDILTSDGLKLPAHLSVLQLRSNLVERINVAKKRPLPSLTTPDLCSKYLKTEPVSSSSEIRSHQRTPGFGSEYSKENLFTTRPETPINSTFGSISSGYQSCSSRASSPDILQGIPGSAKARDISPQRSLQNCNMTTPNKQNENKLPTVQYSCSPGKLLFKPKKSTPRRLSQSKPEKTPPRKRSSSMPRETPPPTKRSCCMSRDTLPSTKRSSSMPRDTPPTKRSSSMPREISRTKRSSSMPRETTPTKKSSNVPRKTPPPTRNSRTPKRTSVLGLPPTPKRNTPGRPSVISGIRKSPTKSARIGLSPRKHQSVGKQSLVITTSPKRCSIEKQPTSITKTPSPKKFLITPVKLSAQKIQMLRRTPLNNGTPSPRRRLYQDTEWIKKDDCKENRLESTAANSSVSSMSAEVGTPFRDLPEDVFVATPCKDANDELLRSAEQSSAKKPEIRVNMSSSVTRPLLEWIYSGECNDMDGIARALLVASIRHSVNGLTRACEYHLAAALTPSNTPDILYLAQKYNAPLLQDAALDYAVDQASAVTSQPVWSTLAEKAPAVVVEFSRRLAEAHSKADVKDTKKSTPLKCF